MSGIIAQNVGRHTGLVKAASAGGAWTLISTVTAAGDATISFTSGLDSTYDEYCFKFINCHPETDAVAWSFNGSADSGSNYNVTKTSTIFNAHHDEANSETAFAYRTVQDIAQGTGFQELSYTADEGVMNDADASASGWLLLFDPSSTTFVKHFMATTQIMHRGGANIFSMNSYTAGYMNTTSAVDAIQFKFGSGDIDEGTISLFGIG